MLLRHSSRFIDALGDRQVLRFATESRIAKQGAESRPYLVRAVRAAVAMEWAMGVHRFLESNQDTLMVFPPALKNTSSKAPEGGFEFDLQRRNRRGDCDSKKREKE